jgi:hypothetical protein
MKETINYAGIEWEVLDETDNGYFCLSKEPLFQKRVDKATDNWSESELREYLNGEWLKSLPETEAFIKFERCLMDEGGLTDYGTCEDIISLLTANEYRKYRSKISTKNKWWWLLTSWFKGGQRFRCVLTFGHVSNVHASNTSGTVTLFVYLDKSVIDNNEEN